MRFRIATRASALAQWQADAVGRQLTALGHHVELVLISTEGDRRLDVPLQLIGGKGVFVKEVQASVIVGDADIAVHSAKDLPARTPDELVIGAALSRVDPRDVLVGSTFAGLAQGAVVATGAPRRRAQLRALRPDLRFDELRGNIDSRLSRVGEFDAIVMAAAALDRLDRHPEITERLAADVMIPQVGQGVIAAECRVDDVAARHALDQLDHAETRVVLTAERAFLDRLGGDCDLPAGAHAVLRGNREVVVLGCLEVDGVIRRAREVGSDPRQAGWDLADQLLDGP